MFFLKKLGLKHIYTDISIFVLATSLKSPNFSIFVNNIKIIIPKNCKKITKVKKTCSCMVYLDISFINIYLELKIN